MKSSQMAAFAAMFCAALFIAAMLARPAFADEPIVGTWKMVSWVDEDLETKGQKAVFGQHPGGLLIFTPEKHFFILLTAEGRKGGQSEADRARNFLSSFAVAGKYRVEGSKHFWMVEVSEYPALVGTEPTRDIMIEGNRLTFVSAPERIPWMDNHMARSTLVWERVTQ